MIERETGKERHTDIFVLRLYLDKTNLLASQSNNGLGRFSTDHLGGIPLLRGLEILLAGLSSGLQRDSNQVNSRCCFHFCLDGGPSDKKLAAYRSLRWWRWS